MISRINVLGHLDERRLMIEVIDEGEGFERIIRDRDFDSVGGVGLNAVDATGSRWGTTNGSATSGSNSAAADPASDPKSPVTDQACRGW